MVALKAHFDGKVLIPDEPVDLPKGKTLLIHVEPTVSGQLEKPLMTGADLLKSGLVGLWKDRTDIGSSPEFARRLREQAQAKIQ